MANMTRSPLIAAGVLMGAGLGGFVDGIVLHQILQWHNMLSSRMPPNDLVAAKVKSEIYDGNFLVNLLMMLLPIVIITAMGFGLYHADKILKKLRGGIK